MAIDTSVGTKELLIDSIVNSNIFLFRIYVKDSNAVIKLDEL